ncbi:MAG: hypothetical protein LLG37_10275, partial [Spirochaetia bacterium]|nr:hypothetical protein [Spirochaetia bacterium]
LIVQSEKMQKRVSRIGIKKAKIIIMNNTKFSSELNAREVRRAAITDKKGKLIVVAGSIREGEEKLVIDGWNSSGSNSVLIIAPRRLNRVKLIEGLLEDKKCNYALWSTFKDYAKIPDYDAVIVDTIGDLSFIYNAGDVAIIGGGFMKYGGHNPMEAAVAGLPIIFGRNMFNFEDTSELFAKEGGAWKVNSASELSDRLAYLSRNPQERARLGGLNKKIIEKFRGSAGTTAMLINEVLLDHQCRGTS